MNSISTKNIFFACTILCVVFFLTSAQNVLWEDIRQFDGVDIVYRAQWWADESRRMEKHPTFQSILQNQKQKQAAMEELKKTDFAARQKIQQESYEAQKINATADAYLLNNFGTEFSIQQTTSQLRWHNLRRAQTYHFDKKQIIVHHTAGEFEDNLTTQDELQIVNDIYKFHTFTRWWWDIGYNFIIWPSGRIYEWRAWGPWVIWWHAKYNNTQSVWIALIWNFDVQAPTDAQYQSLVSLSIAVSKMYNIDPMWINEYHKKVINDPYIEDHTHENIAWHKDAWRTSCPGYYLYEKLPALRQAVAMAKEFTPQVPKATKPVTDILASQKTLAVYVQKLKKKRQLNTKFISSTQSIKKISSQIDLTQAKNTKVDVLLHELSTQYDKLEISCADCKVYFNNDTKWYTNMKNLTLIRSDTNLFWHVWKKARRLTSIRIEAQNNSLITFKNYTRASFAWIPWNTFRWTINISQQPIRKDPKKSEFTNSFVVINSLWMSEYLKWIVETNDQENLEKNKVMALLAKNYILYYATKQNEHPSIPADANYNAIDHPDFFQKYAGAWVEQTLKKRPLALELTKNQVLTYAKTVAILPYFSCGVGFTLSAQELRWRQDTPYLTSKFDFATCKDKKFNWHGVGLSGLWASYLADKWLVTKRFWSITILE